MEQFAVELFRSEHGGVVEMEQNVGRRRMLGDRACAMHIDVLHEARGDREDFDPRRWVEKRKRSLDE